MAILAGDIGGSHSRLACLTVERGEIVPTAEEVYPSGAYPSLEAIVTTFLRTHRVQMKAACVAVAGPYTMLGSR
jgi:glucokinase